MTLDFIVISDLLNDLKSNGVVLTAEHEALARETGQQVEEYLKEIADAVR